MDDFTDIWFRIALVCALFLAIGVIVVGCIGIVAALRLIVF